MRRAYQTQVEAPSTKQLANTLQNSQDYEKQGKNEEQSHIEGDVQLNVMWDPGLDAGTTTTKKDISGKNW